MEKQLWWNYLTVFGSLWKHQITKRSSKSNINFFACLGSFPNAQTDFGESHVKDCNLNIDNLEIDNWDSVVQDLKVIAPQTNSKDPLILRGVGKML